MTRKRFVKLLMANGVSRNVANSLAAYVPPKGAYGKYYEVLTNGEACRAFSAAIQAIADAATKAATSIADALLTFGPALGLSLERRYSNGQSQNAGP